jgi:phosphoglycerol transferase MdoB-like AlkP superfamily enzyme
MAYEFDTRMCRIENPGGTINFKNTMTNFKTMIKRTKQALHTACRHIQTEPTTAVLVNFGLMLIVYYLCRIFFFLVNKSYYPDMTFGHMITLLKGSLQFDISALAYTNMLYLFLQIIPFRFRYNRAYQNVARWVFVTVNSLAVIINCIDIIYFRYVNRRTTNTVFTEFQNEDNLLRIVSLEIFSHWYITLFVLALIFAIYKLYRFPETVAKRKLSLKSRIAFYSVHTLLMCIFITVTVIGMRGGVGSDVRPIAISNANQYVNKGNETAIVLNTPFCIIRTLGRTVYVDPHYFDSQSEVDRIFSPIHSPSPQGEFKPLNVVIIILESFAKEYSGFFNRQLDNGTYTGYTPFLDSLYAEGLTFKYSYSNGRKSIDAMPSILSSIPMFIEPFILTPYSTNDISGVADILKRKGYCSAFFHGAPNGSMGFQAYAKAAGFDSYLGMDEYGNKAHFDGVWAIWDEEFLQFYAKKMNEMKHPFVTSVFTASSHHPFRIPKRYEGVFPKGTQSIHKSIGYSDYALRRFFQQVSQYDWYDSTLFVITADHINQITHDEYMTDANYYSVPILFYHPGSGLKGLDTIPVQHIDILPSVLGYLNYDQTYFAFGQDVFNADKKDRFAATYNNRLYQFMQDDYFMQFDGDETKTVFRYKSDAFLRDNLVGTVPEQYDMETKLKAIIQQYISRIIENRLEVGN